MQAAAGAAGASNSERPESSGKRPADTDIKQQASIGFRWLREARGAMGSRRAGKVPGAIERLCGPRLDPRDSAAVLQSALGGFAWREDKLQRSGRRQMATDYNMDLRGVS